MFQLNRNKLGLVDELGGLNTALQLAAQKAHLDLRKARIAVYPRRRSLRERLRVGLVGPREGLMTELLERIALVETLAREELLLLTLIAKSSKHENAKQPHWAQARSSCWGTRSPPL